jgi:hypothetical protein
MKRKVYLDKYRFQKNDSKIKEIKRFVEKEEKGGLSKEPGSVRYSVASV